MRQGHLAAYDFPLGAAPCLNVLNAARTEHPELSRQPNWWAQPQTPAERGRR